MNYVVFGLDPMECCEARPLSFRYCCVEIFEDQLEVFDPNVIALRMVERFGHFSGWMNFFDSTIWSLISGFVLPEFIKYFLLSFSDLLAIGSSFKEAYLASTSLFRLLAGQPRAILTALL